MTAGENATEMGTVLQRDYGTDVVLECSRAESSLQTGIYALAMGVTYVRAGLGKSIQDFLVLVTSEKEIIFKGCFRD